ncbi:MAG: hypothetical protein KF810_16980 [Rhizobiaceae bacterium]|nr:hypothetical protein [Rhizobiaceae bacterium]
MSLAHQIAQPNGIAARAVAARASAGVPLNLIRVDGGTQSRAMLQNSVIEEYASAIAAGVEFPPVVLFYDGTDHWLADGFHRVRAFAVAGIDLIPADIRQGTRRDAILYSVGANETHGLRRTNDDKRRAVLVLLNDEEWAKWSDREIARKCNVGHPLVASLRPKLTGISSSDSKPRTYTTKHGTRATMNTSAIGKTKQAEPEMDVEEDEDFEETQIDLRRGNKIILPDGMTPVDVARQGMAREQNGEDAATIAKSLKISAINYRAACDIVFLADRSGYSPSDAAIVDLAFKTMLDMKIADAREIIDPVAVKVWGKSKAPRADREQARVDQFEHAFGVINHTCAAAAELDLPYLSVAQAKAAAREVKTARKHLQTLLNRIEAIHHD